MATVKLGSLIIKTLAKPIANSIKQQAKTHPRFKEFCIDVAQTTHRWEHALKTRFLGYTNDPIRPLNDTRAVETGAAFMSETFLLTVAILTLLGETYRSSRQTAKRIRTTDTTLDDLLIDTSTLKTDTAHLQSHISHLSSDVQKLKADLERMMGVVEEMQRSRDVQDLGVRGDTQQQQQLGEKQMKGWWKWVGWGNNTTTTTTTTTDTENDKDDGHAQLHAPPHPIRPSTPPTSQSQLKSQSLRDRDPPALHPPMIP
ncbi:optic atrophy 3 protein-domain-containing protein [Gaertneriomyces semiglobifer]|nr:optic atrophy 3 protein-domain-containing protein [Gaertneriomyces semiglobifer]